VSHRPVVLPGLVLGVVTLAALTGFANLPAEDVPTPAAAAAPVSDEQAQLQVNACRTWQTSVAQVGLDAVVGQIETQAAGGTVAKDVQQAYASAWSTTAQMFGSVASHPQVDRGLVTPMTDLIAGYQQLGAALEKKGADLTPSLEAIDTAHGRASDFCQEVDPA